MIRTTVCIAFVVLVAACGSKAPNGPCAVDPPDPACMQACDPLPGALNTCPAGFHCGPDGLCTAQCTPGGDECGADSVCSSDGQCLDVSGDANLGPDADCPDVSFMATRVTPTVQLLIDRSGSMTQNFDTQSKWNALVAALVGAGGVVTDYQASVYFGATLYTDATSPAGCPDLIPGPGGTGRALNNLGPISSLMNSTPGGATPTGESLRDVWQEMVANPPPANSPPIIVLATDGDPQLCGTTDVAMGRAESVLQAQNSFAAGIPVFVLGVAVNTATTNHLRQVANAGAGQDPVTGTAPYYPASDPTALAMAFDTIIGGVVSCDLTLDGDVSPAQASSGQVRLNGMLLNYGTDWELIGTNTIRLLGAACQALQGSPNPMVTATFPCGSVIE